jgi:hypoxanthine-guanine phosphoribosyltransferase
VLLKAYGPPGDAATGAIGYDAGVNILLSESDIKEGVAELARQIAADYRDRPLTVLGVLTGSIIFLADLIRLRAIAERQPNRAN